MRIKIAALSAFAALALMSCSQDPGDAEPSIRDQACESIKRLTPGSVELSWATEVLSDANSSSAEKSEALKVTLDQASNSAPGKRTEPYTCEGPVFERFAAEYGQ